MLASAEYKNAAIDYTSAKAFDDALRCYEKACALCTETNQGSNVAHELIQMKTKCADICEQTDDVKRAVEFYREIADMYVI